MRKQKGFDMVELMIVIAVFGILAAVTIPAYKDYICQNSASHLIENPDSCSGSLDMMRNGEIPYPEGYDVYQPIVQPKAIVQPTPEPQTSSPLGVGEKVTLTKIIANGKPMLCYENGNCFEEPQF